MPLGNSELCFTKKKVMSNFYEFEVVVFDKSAEDELFVDHLYINKLQISGLIASLNKQ